MNSQKAISTFYKTIKKSPFFFMSIFFLSTGCLNDSLRDIDGIIATPEYAVPVGKATFQIENFISEDSIFDVGADGLLAIKYRQDSVVSLSATDFLADFGDLWDANYSEEKTIGTANIPNITETGMFYLQALVDEIPDQTTREFFQRNNGNNVPLPPFEQNVNFDIGIPVFEEFQKITLKKGTLKFDAINTFPFDLEDVTFQVWDNVSGTLIGSVHSDLLRSGEIFEEDIILDGKTIHNSVFVRLLKFKSPGSTTPVLINLMDRINTRMELVGLQIQSGTLRVAPIEFAAVSDMVEVQTDNNVKLKSASIKSGKLNYSFQSALDIPVNLILELPSAIKNGSPLKDTFNIMNGSLNGTIDIRDYIVNFGMDNTQPYNMLPISLKTLTPGSGQDFITFNEDDLLKVDFQLEDVSINDFLGNAGTYVQTLDSSSLDFGIDFSELETETQAAFFDNPKIEVFYSNSFGIPMEADLNINGKGNFGGNESLNPSTFTLEFPTIQQIGESINGSYIIDKTNSNIVNFLSIYPTAVNYGGTVTVNPNSNSDLNNHISLESKIIAGIDINLPLKFKTSLLSFKDTLSTEPITDELPEMVESIQLVLDYVNDLPFNTKIDLISSRLDSETIVFQDLEIKGANVNTDGQRIESTTDRVTLDLTKQQIEVLLLNDVLVMNVRVSTVNEGNTEVGIYTTDGLEIGVSALVKLRIQE